MMPKSETFAPWQMKRDLRVAVQKFRNADTDENLSVNVIRVGDGTVGTAYDVGTHAWDRISATVKVTFTSEQRRAVLWSGEDVEVTARVIASLRCKKTKLRQALPLRRTAKDTWEGDVTLDRAELVDVVEIKPLVVRVTDGDSAKPGRQARTRGAIIAEGPVADLRIDESSQPFKGGLDVKWEDFAKSSDPRRRDRANLLYDVDVDRSEPRLVLNRAHQDAYSLLSDEQPSSTAAKAARTAILAHVGSATLGHLFRAALDDAREDPETGEWSLPEGWQNTVVRRLLPHLYPEHSSSDARMEQLLASLKRNDRSDLERRLAFALQEDQLTTKTLRSMLAGAGS